MTGQPIPSFDLYAELEVSRSASVATIEAAYRSLAKRVHPDVAAAAVREPHPTDRVRGGAAGDPEHAGADDRHIKRLNIAREWLTDPELRRRYDALTAPRPARALVTTPDAARRAPVPVRRVGVLGSPEPASPRHARFGSDAERIRWLAAAGLGASSLALVAVLVLTVLAAGNGQPGGGNGQPSSFVAAVAGATGGPAAAASGDTAGDASPSPGPGSSPTASPGGPIDPALLAQLQAGAEQTIRRLQRDARLGDLFGARPLLGDTAPGLTVSGLMRATFPSVAAGDIAIAVGPSGAGWVATAGSDTLTSSDGSHWIFDYGERPLAVYRRTTEHQPYFLDPSGRHEIDLRVSLVVATRSTVEVVFTWRFPSATDAAAFSGDGLAIESIALGSTVAVNDPPSVEIASGASSARLTVPVTVSPSTSGTIDVRVLHGTGAYGSVDTVFKLAIL